MSKLDEYEQMTIDELEAFRDSILHSVLHGASSLSFWGNVRKDVEMALELKRRDMQPEPDEAHQTEAVRS